MSAPATHGGRRPGSGRPRKPVSARRVHVTARVLPATKATLRTLADNAGQSVGWVLDGLAAKLRS